MNEITKIHLGRQPFTVAVDAHKALQEYLHAIKRQVGPKGTDVMEEVELRIAELLAERGISGDKVVLLKDVTYVQEHLGKPGDFSDDADDDGTDDIKEENSPKRLFRDPQHGMIAGVAAGVAAYLKVDVVLVRVAFVALTLLWGWGIALYLALWLIVPELKTKSDRLRSEGKAITVDSLKDIVERADVPGATRRVGKTVQSIVRACMRGLLIVTGGALVLAAIASLLAIMTAAAFMLLRPDQAFTAGVFLVNGLEVLVVGLALLAAGIVASFLLLTGVAMLRRKWTLPGWAVAALVGVFLMSVATGAALTPGIVQDVQQRYAAAHHTVHRTLQPFTKLQVVDAEFAQVTFVPGNAHFVEVTYFGKTDPTLITTEVLDDVLVINPQKFIEAGHCNAICLYNNPLIKITVHSPEIHEANVSGHGVGFMIAQPLHQSASLTLQVNEGAHIDLRQVHAGTVEWNSSQPGEPERLTLSNFLPDATMDDYIGLTNDFGVSLYRTNELYVSNLQDCSSPGARIYVAQQPAKVVINDKQFASVQALQAAQNADGQSVYNCVEIAQPQPTEALPVTPGYR